MSTEEALGQNLDSNFYEADYISSGGGEESDFQLLALAQERDHDNKLQTRWIVDPGSNTHVMNSELRLK